MDIQAGQGVVHAVEHGTGRPVLVLHGAGVDHREAEACFEPALDGATGLRRIYPDLPGMGRTFAPETLRSADDVLETLLAFADEVTGGYVAPAAALVDEAALGRIGERWELTPEVSPAHAGPTLLVAGRLDSTVGYAAADLVREYPHASLAVLDDAGHALPHEQPELLRALLGEWLARVERSGR